MITKEQFGLSRYIMMAISVALIILFFVSSSIFRNFYGYNTTLWIPLVLNILFYLGLICLHPDHHRIIGIPLLITNVFGIYGNIRSLISLPTESMYWFQMILPIFSLVIAAASSIALLIIFFKPKNYHLMDFIIVGAVFVASIPVRTISMISYRQLMIHDSDLARVLLATNFINGISSSLQLIMIVLYIVEAKRIQEDISLSSPLDPTKKEMLRELQKLYKDGIMTFNEYQDKKERILNT